MKDRRGYERDKSISKEKPARKTVYIERILSPFNSVHINHNDLRLQLLHCGTNSPAISIKSCYKSLSIAT